MGHEGDALGADGSRHPLDRLDHTGGDAVLVRMRGRDDRPLDHGALGGVVRDRFGEGPPDVDTDPERAHHAPTRTASRSGSGTLASTGGGGGEVDREPSLGRTTNM